MASRGNSLLVWPCKSADWLLDPHYHTVMLETKSEWRVWYAWFEASFGSIQILCWLSLRFKKNNLKSLSKCTWRSSVTMVTFWPQLSPANGRSFFRSTWQARCSTSVAVEEVHPFFCGQWWTKVLQISRHKSLVIYIGEWRRCQKINPIANTLYCKLHTTQWSSEGFKKFHLPISLHGRKIISYSPTGYSYLQQELQDDWLP